MGHGGKRPGAGRKPIGTTERITITLTPEDVDHLDTLADNRSEAVRKLIHSNREGTTMSDHQTYKTRKDAQAEIETMRGWDAKPVKLTLPDDPNADKDGNAWVIQCDGDKYMREDGFVR